MLTWSTDDVPAADRFARWREERGKVASGVTIELNREARTSFHGRLSARPVGSAMLVEMQASAYHVSRTEADIARVPGDSLIISEQVLGGGTLLAGGDEFVVTEGTLSTCYSDLPYVNIPAVQPGFHNRLVRIPLGPYRDLMRGHDHFWLRPLTPAPGMSMLLGSYFHAFVRQAPYLTGAGADHAVQTLAQLALMARGASSPQEEFGRAAIRESMLQKARDLIASCLQRNDLSPVLVAGMLGISPRQLHLLFEPTGVSFSRYVLARRLALASEQLRQQRSLAVAEVAFRCGFDSVATFYRVFRKAYGMSPGDHRQISGEGGATTLAPQLPDLV